MPTSTDRWPLLIALAVALLISAPLPARAHAVRIFAAPAGNTLQGSAYYPGGNGLADAPVQVYGPENTLLAQTATDAEGRFTVPASGAGPFRLVVETPDGHRAEYVVQGAAEGPASPTSRTAPTGKQDGVSSSESLDHPPGSDLLAQQLEEAVARQLRPLREQLDRHEHRLRLRDILGGIGYILGLAGLYYFGAARKEARKRPGSKQP